MISNQFCSKNYDLIIDSLIELKKENIKPIIVSTVQNLTGDHLLIMKH